MDKHVIGPISGMDALEEIRRQGACAKLSPERADLFFSKRKTDTEYAKRVCGTCVVLLACKEAAIKISTKDIKGVLGGLSERERNKMQKE